MVPQHMTIRVSRFSREDVCKSGMRGQLPWSWTLVRLDPAVLAQIAKSHDFQVRSDLSRETSMLTLSKLTAIRTLQLVSSKGVTINDQASKVLILLSVR